MEPSRVPTEAVDVLIVGAGISGIGAAYYLQDRSPNQSFTIIEARSGLGGTWDLFRFPGVRSDSDLHTLGYEFRPWRDAKAIAGADKILSYLKDTAHEFELDKKIRFNQKLVTADWSSAHQRWTATVEHTDTGARDTISARWIFSASGYFRYDEGFTPIFAGQERFAGPVVHPQTWPADLDYSGKRVVVIGSGATAVTLVPAMSSAAHVTMLQRTPSYILPIASEDRIALLARRLLGADRAHPIIRRKNIAVQRALWLFARHFPTQARRVIRWANVRSLPAGFPVDTHFAPPYNPWDQRLCFVPDGDFFAAIRSGKASIETDRISTFTETG
ncbi:MAG: Flavin-containing monooxygenase, partial [Microbacteriaceae bacterium]|nr:Flavin-containing monooxygenase [Microbacteriaceae bacterium]